jgi:hypothetical protein
MPARGAKREAPQHESYALKELEEELLAVQKRIQIARYKTTDQKILAFEHGKMAEVYEIPHRSFAEYHGNLAKRFELEEPSYFMCLLQINILSARRSMGINLYGLFEAMGS